MSKKIWFLMLCGISCLSLLLSPLPVLAQGDGFIAQWHMDEGSGYTITDSSGNDYTGSLQNMDPDVCWVDGRSGRALQFDGIDDYVDCGTELNLGTGPFTVELWVNFDSIDSEQVLIEKYIETFDSNTRTGWGLTKVSADTLRLYGGPYDAPEAALIPDAAVDIIAGRWNYVAFTR